MNARALRRDADVAFGDFEQADLDRAAGEEAVAGCETKSGVRFSSARRANLSHACAIDVICKQ
jgi:hypothetical protein